MAGCSVGAGRPGHGRRPDARLDVVREPDEQDQTDEEDADAEADAHWAGHCARRATPSALGGVQAEATLGRWLAAPVGGRRRRPARSPQLAVWSPVPMCQLWHPSGIRSVCRSCGDARLLPGGRLAPAQSPQETDAVHIQTVRR